MKLTHASFFSGVGGLDLGFERAGWTVVSHSEIDPYASAVLKVHWPDVPNLGDITELNANDIPEATVWTGGFPCQDLSVAGQRRGLAGSRSGLAFAFLDLVRERRPAAIVLENVPGLLTSNAGRDFGALARSLVELRYGWAYRVLDSSQFGVSQRRRRVFVAAVDADRSPKPDSAGTVLSVGARCRRHPATGGEKGARTSGVAADGAANTRTVQAAFGHHGWTLGAQDVDGGYLQVASRSGHQHYADGFRTITARDYKDQSHLVGSSADPGGVRAPDGLAGRLDDRAVATIDDELLPVGLDGHRYRCCGNGVVAPVAEWIGRRLAEALR